MSTVPMDHTILIEHLFPLHFVNDLKIPKVLLTLQSEALDAMDKLVNMLITKISLLLLWHAIKLVGRKAWKLLQSFFVGDACNNPKLNVPCICYCQQYFRMRHFTVSSVGEEKQLEMSSHSRFPHLHFGALSTSVSFKSYRLHVMQATATQGLSLTVEKSQGVKLTPKHWRVLTLTFLYPLHHYEIGCFGRYGNNSQFHLVN